MTIEQISLIFLYTVACEILHLTAQLARLSLNEIIVLFSVDIGIIWFSNNCNGENELEGIKAGKLQDLC